MLSLTLLLLPFIVENENCTDYKRLHVEPGLLGRDLKY